MRLTSLIRGVERRVYVDAPGIPALPGCQEIGILVSAQNAFTAFGRTQQQAVSVASENRRTKDAGEQFTETNSSQRTARLSINKRSRRRNERGWKVPHLLFSTAALSFPSVSADGGWTVAVWTRDGYSNCDLLYSRRACSLIAADGKARRSLDEVPGLVPWRTRLFRRPA